MYMRVCIGVAGTDGGLSINSGNVPTPKLSPNTGETMLRTLRGVTSWLMSLYSNLLATKLQTLIHKLYV